MKPNEKPVAGGEKLKACPFCSGSGVCPSLLSDNPTAEFNKENAQCFVDQKKYMSPREQQLMECLRKAQESLKLAQIEGRHFFNGSWVDKSMTEVIAAIAKVLEE